MNTEQDIVWTKKNWKNVFKYLLKFTSLTSTGWVNILAWSFVWSWSKRALSKILKGVNCISKSVSCCLICNQTQKEATQQSDCFIFLSRIYISTGQVRSLPLQLLIAPLLPLPSWASPSCGLAPAATGLSPGRVGGDATPLAVPSVPCSLPHSAPWKEIKTHILKNRIDLKMINLSPQVVPQEHWFSFFDNTGHYFRPNRTLFTSKLTAVIWS